MERRNRAIIAALICAILVLSIFYSFGINLFNQTPQVELPSLEGEESPGQSGEDGEGSGGVQVAVTPQTVQSIIERTLRRYNSYSRGMLIEYFWGDGETGAVTAQVAVDGGWTRVDLTMASGVIEHTITDGETYYRWYGEDDTVEEGSARLISADLAQRLPTYEDVLEVPEESITDTGYQERGGLACIYVEAAGEQEGRLLRYWISVESGLLVSAETVENDTLVYRMTAYQVVSPLPEEAGQFTLPDGRVLHTVEPQGQEQ